MERAGAASLIGIVDRLERAMDGSVDTDTRVVVEIRKLRPWRT